MQIPDKQKAEALSLIEDFIRKTPWQFARTMRRQPHEYTLRSKTYSDALFCLFVTFIREFGYDQPYNSMEIRYLDIGNMRYWTMGDFLENTILVNRARIYRPPFPHTRNPILFKAKQGSGDRNNRRKAKKG